MNSNQFIALLNKGNELEIEDFQHLEKLHESFPYFQIPAVLAAKYEKFNRESKDFLHLAAVLSPNRTWLKYLVEENIEFLNKEKEQETSKDTHSEGVPSVVVIDSNLKKTSSDEEHIDEEITVRPDELIALKKNKDQFGLDSVNGPQPQNEENSASLIKTKDDIEANEDRPELIKHTSETEPLPDPKDLITPEDVKEIDQPDLIHSIKDIPQEEDLVKGLENPKGNNRQDILKQLENNLAKLKTDAVQKSTNEKQIKEKGATKPKKRRQGDDLIDSIKKKEKREIKDTKKKEQNDIIKAFGNKSIRLAAIKENEEVNKLQDLSISSTKINDRMVSESYAKLLTQQGKKAAAKEIYKKLILKFPQKKAYFADLIKQLD